MRATNTTGEIYCWAPGHNLEAGQRRGVRRDHLVRRPRALVAHCKRVTLAAGRDLSAARGATSDEVSIFDGAVALFGGLLTRLPPPSSGGGGRDSGAVGAVPVINVPVSRIIDWDTFHECLRRGSRLPVVLRAPDTPLDDKVTVTKVVRSEQVALEEIERLNALAADKSGVRYVAQAIDTRVTLRR